MQIGFIIFDPSICFHSFPPWGEKVQLGTYMSLADPVSH